VTGKGFLQLIPDEDDEVFGGGDFTVEERDVVVEVLVVQVLDDSFFYELFELA